MGRWFLSYNSQDLSLHQQIEARLRSLPNTDLFYAPASLRAGGYWLPTLADEIHKAEAFLLLVGEEGLGPWQVLEYYEALDRRVKQPGFPVIVLLLQGQPAPGLPFLRQLHWIVEPDLTSEVVIGRIRDAVAGEGSRPGELWRYTAPYRGLAAMTEADSDFFFGRTNETVATLRAIADHPGCLPLLIGNSGVGKSSLAQAGVIAALKRQAFPERSQGAGSWPVRFQNSRQWVYLTLKPGTDPLKALVETFLATWQFETTDPKWEARRDDWVEEILAGKATLNGLLAATERRFQELGQPKPPAFLLHVDQGEELYARSEEGQRRRFSEVLAQGLSDPRLFALMSLRADFLGALQNDAPLFQARQQIDVPPLREAELLEVVSQPAKLLGARFETDHLAPDLARRTAEESVKDAGALPLLSYLLDDMWAQMVRRGDGVLRLEAQAIELGGVLAKRADEFLGRNPKAEERLRRILTLKLATVREDGEPTRRRAGRSEFSDEEWQLVSELAGEPYRLLVTATPEGREPYAEVAHEAIFRRWQTLRDWITAEREFLIWKARLEADRRQWEAAPESEKKDALLMGFALAQANSWLAKRAEDLSAANLEFINLSIERDTREREQKEQQARRYEEQRNAALLTQSRFLADQANQQTRAGDAGTAMLLALEALPDARGGLERPYAPEAEAALFNAHLHLQERLLLQGHTNTVWSAVFSPDGQRVLTASSDSTARIWEAQTGKEVAVLQGHTDAVQSAVFSPDGQRVLTASSDSTARIWEAQTGQQIAVLQGHTDAVQSAVFSPDGQRVLTASSDYDARIWEAQTGQEVAVLQGHTDAVQSAVFSPDGQRVLTASSDSTARIWEAQTGQQIAVLQGHTDAVQSAVFSPDGQRVLTASSDYDARIWEAQTGQEVAVLQGHTDAVQSAVFSPDGQRVLTASSDSTARIWEAQTGQEVAVLQGHTMSAVFSPDGQCVLTASYDTTARIWEAQTGQQIAVLQGHRGTVLSAVFSPDGQRVLTASHDTTARIWEAQTGQEVAVLQGHTDAVVSAVFSPDGQRVLTASRDTTARIWEAQTGQEVAVLQGHTDAVVSAVFSPDGQRVLTASRDTTARIWEAQTGQEVAVLQGHTDRVLSAVFSPDGQRVLTASHDTTARIWEAQTGKEVAVFQGHTGLVLSAVFSSDGQRVLTASRDTTARIWEAQTGKEVAVFPGHRGTVLSAVFSPDGQCVLTASRDKTARIWRIFPTTQALVNDTKNGVPRCLSREQRVRAFLEPEPPAWCIEREKWPYATPEWKQWLRAKRANTNPPLPDTPE